MKRVLLGALGVLMVVVSLSACSDSGPGLPSIASLEKIDDGDGQRATAGNRLTIPLAVRGLAPDGTPVPRAVVNWSVTVGRGAVLTDSSTVTDGEGRAQVFLTLGPTAGVYTARASFGDDATAGVTFDAMAVAPPTLTTITPGAGQGGDTISVDGSELVDSMLIEIGGRRSELVSISTFGQTARVVIPKCLVPGQVEVRARVGTYRSDAVMMTYQASSAPLRLAAGEFLSVPPTELDGCALFPDAAADSVLYLITPQSVTGTAGLQAAYRLRGELASMPVPMETRRSMSTSASRFHDFVRATEGELARAPRPPTDDVALLTDPLVSIQLGSLRAFRVCDKITCNAVEDFATVRAVAKFVGEHAVIYEDLNAPENGLSDADFVELGETFDDELYGVATNAFGSESDIDGNGIVYILLSPVVNALTTVAECEAAFVSGFFFPLDLLPQAAGDPRSNRAEIFYAIVPDPSGSVTCTHTVDRVKRLVPVTFIHEFQHMISFHQHALFREGTTEETWLNEAMSHLSEELGGLHFETLGDTTRFTRFVLNDLFNSFLYLQDPGAVSPLFNVGSGVLEERGGAWLFLRFVVDRHGPDITRRLSETNLRGSANIEEATGEPIARLLSDWFLANYASGRPGFTAPSALSYTTWDFYATFESLNDQVPNVFTRPFPIEPPTFVGGTFDLTGVLRSGSGDYILVLQEPGQRGFTVKLVDETDAPLSGPAEPRLNILRIR